MFQTCSLSKIYRSHSIETYALSCVNISVEDGDFVAIMGPSGCGKSTLLNILGMLDKPSSGEYVFSGENVADYSEARLANIRRQNIGFVFQSFNLIDELTVFENVELALLYQDFSRRERKERTGKAMERVGIFHRSKHIPSQLSGGQQQRVAVARAIVGRQPLILADEPTGNLDSANGREVMNILQSLNNDGITIIMVTHSPEHADCTNRTINLLDGSIVSEEFDA